MFCHFNGNLDLAPVTSHLPRYLSEVQYSNSKEEALGEATHCSVLYSFLRESDIICLESSPVLREDNVRFLFYRTILSNLFEGALISFIVITSGTLPPSA